MKIKTYFIILFNLIFFVGIISTEINAQTICEECEQCEEGEEEAGEEIGEETGEEIGEETGEEIGEEIGEETENITAEIGEEGAEISLEEADMIGTEFVEVGTEFVEVGAEAGIEMGTDSAAFLAVDAIPIIGEIVAVIEALALFAYGLYELIEGPKLAEEHREHMRELELQKEKEAAEKTEGKYTMPLVPEFSVSTEDLDGEAGVISHHFFLKSTIVEEDVRNYLSENNIKCPDVETIFGEGYDLTSVNMNVDPLKDFTPCAFIEYYHPITIGDFTDVEGPQNYTSDFYRSIPNITLTVNSNKQAEVEVASYWKFEKSLDGSIEELNLSTKNPIRLVLSTYSENGFTDLSTVPYTAVEVASGTDSARIAFTINEFDISSFSGQHLWIRMQVKGHESYGRTYRKSSATADVSDPCGKRLLYGLFEKLERERGTTVREVIPANIGYERPCTPDRGIGIALGNGSTFSNTRHFPTFSSAGLELPHTVERTLTRFRVRDYQPKDTEESIETKAITDINPFPELHVSTLTDFSGVTKESADYGKNHIKVELPIGNDLKSIDHIQLKGLTHGVTVILSLEEDNTGAILTARSLFGSELEEDIGVNAFWLSADGVNLELGSSNTNDLSNPLVATPLDQYGWMLWNVPIPAGAILEVTTFYEDGTLSRDVLSIPVTRENILPRAYYHLQYGYDGSYFTQDVAGNDDFSFMSNATESSKWLIEAQDMGLYAIMNKESGKVLGIVNDQLGVYDWIPGETDFLWSLDFLNNTSLSLYNIGKQAYLTKSHRSIEYSANDWIILNFSEDLPAEPILSQEPVWISNRENSNVLASVEALTGVNYLVYDYENTADHLRQLEYNGCLRYTIKDFSDDTYLDFDMQTEDMTWSSHTRPDTLLSTLWLIRTIDEGYFTLANQEYLLHSNSIGGVTIGTVDNAPMTNHNYHFILEHMPFSTADQCASDGIQVTGSVIGSSGTHGNNMTKEKVFDGIDTTFFDAPEENGQWVGLDLGSRKVITCIKFRPRKDQENRMRGGQFQISNTADFSHTITIYTIPTDATLSFQDYYITSLNAEGVNTQYVRYLSPDEGFGNVAEVTVYTADDSALLFTDATQCASDGIQVTGSVIGSSGTYGNNMTKEKVFDGIDTTFFDAPEENGQWVGLDLGSRKVITCIKFRPRKDQENRMRGGQFQISNTADFSHTITIYTIPTDATLSFQDYYITSLNAEGVNTQYVRYLSPDEGFGNVAEVTVYTADDSALLFTDATQCASDGIQVTGSVIGSSGTYGNNMTKEKVFDGIDTTFFDAPEENGQWVGLDLGSRKVITCIKFRPRKDQENRMRGGQFQISNTADFSHTITIYTIPTDATLSFQDYYITSLNAEGVNTQYVRYLSPDEGFGNVAEVTVYTADDSALLFTDATQCASDGIQVTGSVIGSSGTYGNNMTKEKVFDGIDTTFFDAPEENGQWVGLDLGSRKVITCIKFRPRKDQENRMRGGQFQISNTADFSHTITIYTIPTDATLSFQDYYITSLNAEGVNTQYVRYLSPDEGFGNVAEISIQTFATTYPGVMRIESQSLSIERQSLSIEEDLIHIFPNPAENQLHIEPRGDVVVHNYQIFDIIGSVMLSQRLEDDRSEKITLDVNNFPAGIYFLSCDMQKEDGESVRTSYKFVKN